MWKSKVTGNFFYIILDSVLHSVSSQMPLVCHCCHCQILSIICSTNSLVFRFFNIPKHKLAFLIKIFKLKCFGPQRNTIKNIIVDPKLSIINKVLLTIYREVDGQAVLNVLNDSRYNWQWMLIFILTLVKLFHEKR